MNYTVSEFGTCVVLTFSGNLTGGPGAAKVREELHGFIDKGKKDVVADLSNVKFVDSMGLGMLIGGLTTMRNAGGDLRISGANQRVNSLLTVTKLFTVFKSYGTPEEAVTSFRKTRGADSHKRT